MSDKCIWSNSEDDDSCIYNTECGHTFYFTDDGIPENGVKFCMYCGKLIDLKTEDK